MNTTKKENSLKDNAQQQVQDEIDRQIESLEQEQIDIEDWKTRIWKQLEEGKFNKYANWNIAQLNARGLSTADQRKAWYLGKQV